jgi:hypothetical protein
MHSRFFINLFAALLLVICLLAMLISEGIAADQTGDTTVDAVSRISQDTALGQLPAAPAQAAGPSGGAG